MRAIALIERDPDFGTDRLTSGLLDFGGAHLTFICSTQAVPYQRVNAFGTQGTHRDRDPVQRARDGSPAEIFLDDGSSLERQLGRGDHVPDRGPVSPAERGVLARHPHRLRIRERDRGRRRQHARDRRAVPLGRAWRLGKDLISATLTIVSVIPGPFAAGTRSRRRHLWILRCAIAHRGL